MKGTTIDCTLEKLREELNKLISSKEIDLTSKEVIIVSQELDQALNEFEKIKKPLLGSETLKNKKKL